MCKSIGRPYCENIYFRCTRCDGVFKIKSRHLSLEDEKKIYLNHNNDVDDIGYQNSVRPLVDRVIESRALFEDGLDYGCGTGAVASKLLRESKFNMYEYDPFFAKREELLNRSYNFIIASEVIEHFANPKLEFELLRSLLKDGGGLFCKTHILRDDIDFASWYYRRDPTHIFFYSDRTFKYIKEQFFFSELKIYDRVAVLTHS